MATVLDKQLKILEADLVEIKLGISQLSKQQTIKEKEISDLKTKIADSHVTGLIEGQYQITDHALVRYFERVQGVDIGKIKREIFTDDVVELIQTFGSGKIIKDGFLIVVKDKVIITIAPNGVKKKTRKRKKKNQS